MISKHTAVPTPPPLCKGCQARCGRLRLQCGPSHSGPAFKGRAVFRELLDHVGGVGGSPRSPVLLPRCCRANQHTRQRRPGWELLARQCYCCFTWRKLNWASMPKLTQPAMEKVLEPLAYIHISGQEMTTVQDVGWE